MENGNRAAGNDIAGKAGKTRTEEKETARKAKMIEKVARHEKEKATANGVIHALWLAIRKSQTGNAQPVNTAMTSSSVKLLDNGGATLRG